MILSHAVSDSVLCATAVLSLTWYRTHLNGQLRSYLSITAALIGVTASLGALRFMGLSRIRRSHRHRRAPWRDRRYRRLRPRLLVRDGRARGSLDIYHYCIVAAILAISRSATSLSRD